MFWGFLYWKFHKKFAPKTWRGPHHFLVEPAVSFQGWLGISTLRKHKIIVNSPGEFDWTALGCWLLWFFFFRMIFSWSKTKTNGLKKEIMESGADDVQIEFAYSKRWWFRKLESSKITKRESLSWIAQNHVRFSIILGKVPQELVQSKAGRHNLSHVEIEICITRFLHPENFNKYMQMVLRWWFVLDKMNTHIVCCKPWFYLFALHDS